MARKPYEPTAEEKKLKVTIIEHFNKWKSEKPLARNQKKVASNCPSITEPSLSRILNESDNKCPDLNEAIEIFLVTDGMKEFENYVKTTNTESCHYLRSLLRGKKDTHIIDRPIKDNTNLMIEMNERFDRAKKELNFYEKFVYQLQGGAVASIVVAYIIFVNKDVFLG